MAFRRLNLVGFAVLALLVGANAQGYEGTGPIPSAPAALLPNPAVTEPVVTPGLLPDPLTDPQATALADPLADPLAADPLAAGPDTPPEEPIIPAIPDTYAAAPDELPILGAGPDVAPTDAPAVDIIARLRREPTKASVEAPTASELVEAAADLVGVPAAAPGQIKGSLMAGAMNKTVVGAAVPGSLRGVAGAGASGVGVYPPPMPVALAPELHGHESVVAAVAARLASAAMAPAPVSVVDPTYARSGLGYQGALGSAQIGYEPVPELAPRDPSRVRVPSNIVFTLTGHRARLNGARLFIQNVSPAVSFLATAPVYRSGVVNTTFWVSNLTSPAGWLGNPDAVLYGTRRGKAVAAVLNIQNPRYIDQDFLADVAILPRQVGPLYAEGVVAAVQSSSLAGTDGNGLTVLSTLPGGVEWFNVALVVDSVLQEFRPAPGAKVRPVVSGDAGSQFACDGPAFWKPALCAAPELAP